MAEQRENFDFSPNELDEVEGRLDQLYRLKKKYGATVEDMLAYLDNCRRELDDIDYAGRRAGAAGKGLRQGGEGRPDGGGGAVRRPESGGGDAVAGAS